MEKTKLFQAPTEPEAPLLSNFQREEDGWMRRNSHVRFCSRDGIVKQPSSITPKELDSALEHAWITSRQIEVGRRSMTRNACRGGKIWVCISPDKPVTVRLTKTCMGSGKGSPEFWVAVVKPGRMLYEMGGVTKNIARRAISIAASKMPIRTQFIISG
ncbi:uncharacterized protein LOC111368250 [Olea europaea var. sylvestris]|uniref:uncharacterized protein LOC111368250 n=1 Tax=Olea europaea var. sylvestris TaxID=158386 RepID=UPI000C1D62A1|nr:uncharacterized protein LOC111368250 [Olea europaea var. sylvestris]